MTVTELHSLVESISFVGGLKVWDAHVEVRRAPHSSLVEIIFRYKVPHRDTGVPGWIHSVTCWDKSWLLAMKPEKVIQLLHRDLIQGFMHELHESLLIAGKRIVEPHPERPRSAA